MAFKILQPPCRSCGSAITPASSEIQKEFCLWGRHLPSTAGGSPRATVVRAKGALAVLPRNGTRQARHTRLKSSGTKLTKPGKAVTSFWNPHPAASVSHPNPPLAPHLPGLRVLKKHFYPPPHTSKIYIF